MNDTFLSIEEFHMLRQEAVITNDPLAIRMSAAVYQAAQALREMQERMTQIEKQAERAVQLDRSIKNALLLAKPAARKGKKPTAKDMGDALKYVREELEKVVQPEADSEFAEVQG